MKKQLFITLLVISNYVLAGGGGSEGRPPFPPKSIVAKCTIEAIDQIDSESLPEGEHYSFFMAQRLLSQFAKGSDFYLRGGDNHENIYSIYYASFIDLKEHYDFGPYKSPVSLDVNMVEFPEITLIHKHTWSRSIASFPVIGETFLKVSKNPTEQNVNFSLIWTYETSFVQKREIDIAVGEMECE